MDESRCWAVTKIPTARFDYIDPPIPHIIVSYPPDQPWLEKFNPLRLPVNPYVAKFEDVFRRKAQKNNSVKAEFVAEIFRNFKEEICTNKKLRDEYVFFELKSFILNNMEWMETFKMIQYEKKHMCDCIRNVDDITLEVLRYELLRRKVKRIKEKRHKIKKKKSNEKLKGLHANFKIVKSESGMFEQISKQQSFPSLAGSSRSIDYINYNYV